MERIRVRIGVGDIPTWCHVTGQESKKRRCRKSALGAQSRNGEGWLSTEMGSDSGFPHGAATSISVLHLETVFYGIDVRERATAISALT